LVVSYPVLCEKQKHIVVQLKSTVFITPKEIIQGTGHQLQEFVSNYKPNEEMLLLINTSLKMKKVKKTETKNEDKMSDE
jgi:hypothetical protein